MTDPDKPTPTEVDAIVERLGRALSIDPPVVDPALARAPAAARLTALRRRLAAEIDALLARDRARLVQLLYAVDVDERQVDAVVASERLDAVGQRLADLVVERALAARRLAGRFAVTDPDAEFGQH